MVLEFYVPVVLYLTNYPLSSKLSTDWNILYYFFCHCNVIHSKIAWNVVWNYNLEHIIKLIESVIINTLWKILKCEILLNKIFKKFPLFNKILTMFFKTSVIIIFSFFLYFVIT